MTSPDFTFRTNGTYLPQALGTTLQILHVNGAGNAAEWADVGRLSAVRYYNLSGSPHTWTKPDNLRYVRVTVIGGGGGSGGVAATGASESAVSGPGGGGGVSIKVIQAASLGATETVTIGAGGTAGSAGNNNGGDGGTSSFGSHCQATGGGLGTGGGASSASLGQARFGGNGGVGSGGDLNLNGSDGTSATYGGTNTFASTGMGGGNMFAGMRRAGGNNNAGQAGYFPGGGASSAVNISGLTAKAGGQGANGLVIVEEYT